MKKLLILAIALTFCLVVGMCIMYVLLAVRAPVLILAPDGEITLCTLYPFCTKRIGLGVAICPDTLSLGGPCEEPRYDIAPW